MANSETVAGLRADICFNQFVESCAHFYNEAIHTKDMAYRTFDEHGGRVSLANDGIGRVGRIWKRRIEAALDNVRSEFRQVEGLPQS